MLFCYHHTANGLCQNEGNIVYHDCGEEISPRSPPKHRYLLSFYLFFISKIF